MNELPLISIIVPIFNSADYLNRCINSLLSQTYRNLEIILVDDGSTDNSSAVCKFFVNNDNRVKYFHKENGGQSSARNFGLNESSGDYVTFVDSDDWIEVNAIDDLLKKCGTNRTIANTKTNSVNDDGIKKLQSRDDYNDKCSLDYIRSLLLHKGDSSVCTKLFKREIIGDIKFDETRLNEDVLFMLSIADGFDKIVYTENADYNYFYHIGSTSRSFGKAVHDMVYNARAICAIVDERFPQLREEAFRFEVFQNMAFLCACPIRYDRKGDVLCYETKKYLKKNFWKAMKNKHLTPKEKMRMTMLCVSPRFTSFLISILHK